MVPKSLQNQVSLVKLEHSTKVNSVLYIYYTRIRISNIIKDLKCLLMKRCASSKLQIGEDARQA